MGDVRIQDDLFEAVNGEWLEQAVIPEDKPATGGFWTLMDDVEQTLMSDFAAFARGEQTTDIPGMADAIKLYRKVLDTERRNREGIAPVMPLLNRIRALNSVADLNRDAKELLLAGVALPFECSVEADMKDATTHAFDVKGPSTILPDPSYYGTEMGSTLMPVYCDMALKLLAFTGLSETEAKQYVDDAVKFDSLFADKVKGWAQWADYVNDYNPLPLETVCEELKPFDLKTLLAGFYGGRLQDKVIVKDPNAIELFHTYFNEETFPLYVHWAYIKALIAASGTLSEEIASIGTTYSRAIQGVAVDPSIDKQAYQVAGAVYSEAVGVYYGRKYFGEEAKKDIIALVKKVIATYRRRVAANDFLAQSTKDKAIVKLDTLTIKMGYPDDVPELYKTLKVDETASYYQVMADCSRARALYELGKYNKKVDPNAWQMPGHMVNACYDPFRNDITFPAGILQKPFYSIHQTASENLGGIGAVIAHEISHAFDTNGAHFDEHGNLVNWWKDEDFAAFQERAKGMIEQWDGIEIYGGKVNGAMVCNENIADNGGMAVALEIMRSTETADYRLFFENWAKVWCDKANMQYRQYLLANDVHSPNRLRANIPVRNFPEWYDTFGVTENDRMYIAPEKRVVIW